MYKRQVIHRQSDTAKQWRCSRYDTCKAKLKTNVETSIILNEQSHHSHEMENLGLVKGKDNLRCLIQNNPYAKPEQITLMALNTSTSTGLPSSNKIKSFINNERRKHKLTEPNTIDDLKVENIITNSGESFLLFDNESTDARIQIFGTIKDIERTMVADELMCDGTFNVVPKLFTQLFIIMSKKYGKWFPSIYCLCQNKCQETYEIIWKTVLDLCVKNNIEINEELQIHIDFEKAIINAILLVLPSAKIMHCLFHLGQSVFRKVQSLGLTSEYRNSESFRTNVRMLVALAFVEPEKVVDIFNKISEGFDNTEILTYFENTYIQGKVIRACRQGKIVRASALFPVHMWTCWNRIEQCKDRTNNVQESFHNGLSVAAGKSHIGYNEMLSLLLKEHHKADHNIKAHIIDGIPPPKRNRKQNDRNSAIDRLYIQYKDHYMNVNDYLYGIQSNIKVD